MRVRVRVRVRVCFVRAQGESKFQMYVIKALACASYPPLLEFY